MVSSYIAYSPLLFVLLVVLALLVGWIAHRRFAVRTRARARTEAARARDAAERDGDDGRRLPAAS